MPNVQSSGIVSRPANVASTSFSFPVTVAAGTNRRLAVAYLGSRTTGNDQGAPAYGGIAMTAVPGASSTDTLTIVARWYVMDDPPVGTANVSVTNPANSNNGAYVWLVLDDVAAGSAGSIGGHITTGTSTPTTATVGANDLAIVAAVGLAGSAALGASTTAVGAAAVETAQGATARGWGGRRVGGNPSLTFASGQIAWGILVVPGPVVAFAFSGTVAAQTGTTGTASAPLALAGYFSGGTTPYSYAVFSGALPPGLSLNTSTGEIIGTPTAAGSYSAVIRGTDAAAATANTNSIAWTISAAPATATTLTGPSGGQVGVASAPFTVGANGDITGTVTVTPSDGGGGGTFSPTSVAISAGSPTATFTYTPASAGAKTISISDTGSLTDATPITYTASATAGTITVAGIRNGSGGLLASTLLPNVIVVQRSNRALLLALTDQATSDAGALSITSGVLPAGTPCMVFAFSNDGTQAGAWAATVA